MCPANLQRQIDELNIELGAWREDPNGERLEELEKKLAAANKNNAALECEVATLKKDNQMLEYYVAEVEAQLEEALNMSNS